MRPLEIYSYREMAQQITKNIDNDKKYHDLFVELITALSNIPYDRVLFFLILQMQQFYDYFYLGVLFRYVFQRIQFNS